MKAKRFIGMILAAMMLLTSFTVSVSAAEPTAKIVGVDGSTTELRAGQLLEVVTEGFSEDAKLQYTYDRSELKMRKRLSGPTKTYYPYFDAFENRDMFDAESVLDNTGRNLVTTYRYFAISNRLWASSKSWYLMTNEDLEDITITVTVMDTNRASSTYGKTAVASYTGFKVPDLSKDLNHAVIALFVGDTTSVLRLLAQADVTHITCENCIIGHADMGDESIASVKVVDDEYRITGVAVGETQLDIEITKKPECSMHSNSTGTAVTKVRVFKKPVPTPSYTTVTLTELEEGVYYELNGVKKLCEDASEPLVFEGLTPGTDYRIYVEAEYVTDVGTSSTFAHVDTTTLEEEKETEPDPDPEIIVVPEYRNDYAYIFGYDDVTMAAENTLLRCEVSAMIHRLVKQNDMLGGFVYDEAAEPVFPGTAGTWYRSAVEYMHHRDAFNVDAGEELNAEAAISRGEAFKLVCIGLGFTEDTHLPVEDYAHLLRDWGYVVGDEYGHLHLDQIIKRSEFCTIYNKIIGRENSSLVLADGTPVTAETYGYTDLPEDAWYYEIMLRATSAYDEEGNVDLELRGIRNNLDDYR